ncbi:MAG TPA: MFS transporter [Bryobacteraceae bacterium]|nr:MFS transporter [Bryobacteraceae bacterium]
MESASHLRWLAISVFVLSSALNYLDRMVLSAIAPTLMSEFHLDSQNFGYLISAFSLTYAFSAPLMGLLIDRIGLTAGACIVVGLWSLAGISTGFTNSFAGLLLCRAALGFAEAGGIPASGKAMAVYLPPKDRAMGAALSQIGLTIGSVGAPLLTALLMLRHGWRSVFVTSGMLGFLWIPLWLYTARRVPAAPGPSEQARPSLAGMLRDRRFLGLTLANVLAMTVYSLWTVWTTHFLVKRFQLTQQEANSGFAWIPPIFATLGGLLGGWVALRLIRSGLPVLQARSRIALWAAVFVCMTAAAPLMPTPALATAAVCASLFAITCLSVNYYSIPLDIFGPQRAGFAVSVLTGSFGLMQTFLSPLIGRWCDQYGYQPVCTLVAILPLASYGVLQLALRNK